MTVLKQYNPVSGLWEAIVVGAAGPAGPEGPSGANVITLNSGEPIPPGTPPGTLILVVPA